MPHGYLFSPKNFHWPRKEDVLRYHPKCFKRYKNVIGINDCTEGILEKPSIAKAQSQTYSAYKSRNTWKNCYVLLLLELYHSSPRAMEGLHLISDLLVSKISRLIIPPFLRDKNRFSKKNCKTTSNVAKARIHVVRAIARVKDFRIFNGTFPITLKDQLDDIFTICCALTNLGSALVPL